MLIKIAWRNIWRNKRRSLITAASVLFALFFAVALRSLQLGIYDSMISNIVSVSTGYVQVHKNGFWEEKTIDNTFLGSDSIQDVLLQSKGVKGVIPRLESFTLASTGPSTKVAALVGVDFELESTHFNLDDGLKEGSFPKPGERSLVISRGIADYFDLSVNDTLVLLGQGYHGVSANGKYPISAIVKLRSPELDKRLIFLPIEEAQVLYGAYDRLSSYIIIPQSESAFDYTAKKLRTEMDTASYEIMTWEEMMPELVQTIQADSSGGIIMLFILYLVISFGIFGTILMLASERFKEYGILISIGMQRWRLATITLLEMSFLSALGVLGGYLFSLPLVFYYNYNPITLTGAYASAMEEYGFEAQFATSTDPSIALTHGLTVLIITLVLTFYAVWKIYTIKPVNAIRS